ncbi:MAG: purine-binding chemotaxis protein CheW [Bdellovibrionales bacterium]|nr:purine-binding chemotaxis protein CheW [Bdellovibrionales bacterium]
MSKALQYTTFSIGHDQYAIEVGHVQEITRSFNVTPVRLSPPYIKGLVNLRGQLSVAVDVRTLVQDKSEATPDWMSIVCRREESLVSLVVDRIGDVIEVQPEQIVPPPESIGKSKSALVTEVIKTEDRLISVLNFNHVWRELCQKL